MYMSLAEHLNNTFNQSVNLSDSLCVRLPPCVRREWPRGDERDDSTEDGYRCPVVLTMGMSIKQTQRNEQASKQAKRR